MENFKNYYATIISIIRFVTLRGERLDERIRRAPLSFPSLRIPAIECIPENPIETFNSRNHATLFPEQLETKETCDLLNRFDSPTTKDRRKREMEKVRPSSLRLRNFERKRLSSREIDKKICRRKYYRWILLTRIIVFAVITKNLKVRDICF